MNQRDYIGKQGETVFAYLIGGEATFFVQVKATSMGYTGVGANRKLRVNVSKKDVMKLKRVTGPAFVAGIDVQAEIGFLVAITENTGDRLSGIPCAHKIDCDLIENLWKEIDGYWAQRNMLAKRSMFS